MRIPVYTKGVLQSPLLNIVFLQEIDGLRFLQIFTGPHEADYISNAILGFHSERPLTHDLFLDVFAQIEIDIKFVVLTEVIGETFYAKIVLDNDGETVIIDARPTDAIILAIKSDASIYIEEDILDIYGHTLEIDENLEDALKKGEKKTNVPGAFQDFIGNLSELDDLDKPPKE